MRKEKEWKKWSVEKKKKKKKKKKKDYVKELGRKETGGGVYKNRKIH